MSVTFAYELEFKKRFFSFKIIPVVAYKSYGCRCPINNLDVITSAQTVLANISYVSLFMWEWLMTVFHWHSAGTKNIRNPACMEKL